MKTVKNITLFLAGATAFWLAYSAGMTRNTLHPREGTVVYEDDEMKVTRMNVERGKNVDVATILYKNH